jgi:hypothetical protein
MMKRMLGLSPVAAASCPNAGVEAAAIAIAATVAPKCLALRLCDIALRNQALSAIDILPYKMKVVTGR